MQERVYDTFRAAGITGKPVVNVEQFGGWTNGFARGVFGDALRSEYPREVQSAARRGGLSTFFHNGPWMQTEPMRYDLAGRGTAGYPGVRWWFEAVRAARGL